MQIKLAQFSTILSVEYGIARKNRVVTSYVPIRPQDGPDDVHMKIFSLPTIADNSWLACEVELS